MRSAVEAADIRLGLCQAAAANAKHEFERRLRDQLSCQVCLAPNRSMRAWGVAPSGTCPWY
jgi:hypothetical protein